MLAWMALWLREVFLMKSILLAFLDLIAIHVTPSSFAASASAKSTILSVGGRSMRQTALMREMLMYGTTIGLRG